MRRALAALLLLAVQTLGMDYDRASGEYIDVGVESAHGLTAEHSYAFALEGGSDSAQGVGLFSRYSAATNRTWLAFAGQDLSGNPARFRSSSGSDGSGAYDVIGTADTVNDGLIEYLLAFSGSSSAILYENGSPVGTDGSVNNTETGSWSTKVANHDSGTSNTFDGRIHYSYLWDVKLPPEAAQSISSMGLPLFDPVSSYRPDLQYGLGTACTGTIQDEMATGADGTCVNTPTASTIPYRLHR